jgi:hypothetical protein
MNPHRLYTRRFMAAMVAYIILLFVSISALNRIEEGQWLRYPIALLPVIPIIFGAAAYLSFIRNLDELQRRIQLDGISFGFAITSILSVALGFLEIAGLPQIGMIWVFPMLVGFWGIGTYLANLRYR